METVLKLLHEFWANLVVGQVQQLGYWNYLLLALFVFVEGPIATLLGAAAASAGLLNPVFVFLSASVGNLIADMFWYSLGRAGKISWLQRFLWRLGVGQEQVMQIEDEIRHHSFRIVLLAKLTLSFSIPALVVAGMAHVSWHKVIRALIPGEYVWTGSLVLSGYYYSQSLKHLERSVQVITLLGGILLLSMLTKYVKTRYGTIENIASATSALDTSLVDRPNVTIPMEES